jgi:arylsulfatase A
MMHSKTSVPSVVLSALLVLVASHSAAARPNVVILLGDDLGSKDIGCDGGPVKTPALDGLAANGVRFTDFHSGAPVCSTARAVLLTGRHHLRTGVFTVIQDHIHNMHLRKSEVTIAEVLKANGYDTAHLGKWHLGTPFRKMNKPWVDEHGFDYWFATDLNAAPSHRNPSNFWRNRERVGELEGYACQLVVDEAITWLDEKRDAEKPFFLNIWFHEPHAPLAAPDEIVSQYGKLNDPAAIYSATIDNTDRAIARLLKKLEQLGALEDTIIIYTSDHGSYRHERNGDLNGGKGSLMEGGTRTPGIIHWPRGIKAGRTEDTPAGAIDLLPTICGLAGIDKPSGVHLDGSDLSPLLTGRRSDFQRHQPLTWHSPTSQPVVAIREGKYSLVGSRDIEYPKDQEAIRVVMEEMKTLLEEKHGRKLTRDEVWHKAYNSDLKTPEWNRLRGKFVMLSTFQEAWIPLIKAGSGGVSNYRLFDLSEDPGQRRNIAGQFPELTDRLKKQVMTINADVLKEAPDWGPYKPVAPATPQPTPNPALKDAELDKLLKKIEATGPPKGYDGSIHQVFVDKRMAGLTAQQRGRVGQLWKEKRRLHPNMSNRGMSFVKIMEQVASPARTSPNVLFIAVDDLNDWVGCLGGHPQAKTPNIDSLARKGVLFEQAHCAAPLCSPSRTSIMTGLRPSTTGIYGNLNWFRDLPQYRDWVTLPQYFRQHGYKAWGGGKLFHQPAGKFSDPASWDHQYSTRMGTPFPPVEQRYRHGLKSQFSTNPILARLIDWGPIDQPTEATADWKTADGAAQFLQRDHDKPFFLGCGIYLPHLPWYAPKKFFDMHPLDQIQLPPHKADDLDDIPPMGLRMAGKHVRVIRESGKWKEAVQGCLAADSFADACAGHVLDALEKSPHRDNTIVVLWGDHGYDVGEKKFAKSALWEQTTRTPLIIHVPDKLAVEFGWTNTKATRCKRPVSLVDLYPTLIDLCGLPKNEDIDGRSLAPLVRNPEAEWQYPAIITHSPHWHGVNHAIRSQRWHYIRYRDGSEELYDAANDPNQWTNLANDPRHASAKAELAKWLPKKNAPHSRGPAKNDAR